MWVRVRGWLIVVTLQGNRMHSHISFNVNKLNPMVRDSVLEHAKVGSIDGHLECRRLCQDQEIKVLSRVKRHPTKSLFRAPHLVHHMIPDNCMFIIPDTQMEGYVIPGLSNTACL